MYYIGEWKRAEPHGAGKMFLNNGTYYEGPFAHGDPDGIEGLYIFTDGSYKRG